MVGLWGAVDAKGVKSKKKKKKKKKKHGHVAYQIDGDDKQNRMQVVFYP